MSSVSIIEAAGNEEERLPELKGFDEAISRLAEQDLGKATAVFAAEVVAKEGRTAFVNFFNLWVEDEEAEKRAGTMASYFAREAKALNDLVERLALNGGVAKEIADIRELAERHVEVCNIIARQGEDFEERYQRVLELYPAPKSKGSIQSL